MIWKKGKVLKEIKIKVVEDYLEEKRSVRQIADQLQVSCYSVEEWIRKYKAFGLSRLITKHTLST
ncbi:helix-turn-helix domain-containing protein [Clostridium botulinum]|uniref:helix-turn-helix domain-containing protein n=1 Tax=Clostridium botulinum TaxID=1491 RepID=UPI0012B699E0